MSTGAWLILLLVITGAGVIGVLIAYSRGHGIAAEKVLQYDKDGATKLKQLEDAAQKQFDAFADETDRRRAELAAALTITDDGARLKALAKLANDWNLP